MSFLPTFSQFSPNFWKTWGFRQNLGKSWEKVGHYEFVEKSENLENKVFLPVFVSQLLLFPTFVPLFTMFLQNNFLQEAVFIFCCRYH